MSTRRALIGLAVVTLVGAAGVFIYAAPGDDAGPGRADALFARCDADGDGRISRDEFPGADEAFARMDANGDGVVTREEAAAVRAGRGQGGQAGLQQGAQAGGRAALDPAQRWRQMLERFDADGDGQLSAEEFRGAPRIFTLLDQDGDGVVTQAEATRLAPGGQAAPGEPGAGAPPADQAGPARRALNFEQMLQRFDRDGDGKVSQEEWPGREEMFGRLDADGDGFITGEEVAAAQPPQARPQPIERPNLVLTLIRIMDEDGDGQVSAEEWANFHADADVNEDALLSQDELMKKVQEALRPREEPAPAAAN